MVNDWTKTKARIVIDCLRNPKLAQRLRRVMFLAGAMLFSLAVLDRLALLPGTASSDGLVELVPFIKQGWFFQLVIAFIGVMLMRGPKYRESEFAEIQQGRRAKVTEHRQAFVNTHRSQSAAGQSRLARGPTPPPPSPVRCVVHVARRRRRLVAHPPS